MPGYWPDLAVCRLQATPLKATAWTFFCAAYQPELKPIAVLSVATDCCTRPSDGFSAASEEIVLLPSSSCWTSGGSDEAAVRPIRSIGAVARAPRAASPFGD